MNIVGLQENVPLAQFTTFKIGGPARYFVVATTEEEIATAVAEAKANNIQWTMLGGGSDILVADKGFNGLVIKSELNTIAVDEGAATITAGSGVRLAGLIVQSVKHGLTGLEFAIGVPASVGGAVWANLGARGSEIANVLGTVLVIEEQGKQKKLTAAECHFSYRESIFKHRPWVILQATFQLQHGNKELMKDTLKELNALRTQTQDVSAKTAGCAFRNPVGQTEVPAAKLIDDLGLKGKKIGGAQVSEKHANFILNTGTATADDVAQLISYVKQQVRDATGIQLQEEVEYVGF